MDENNEIHNEFEHNDGIGDLLRERESLQFSWAKTGIVLVTLLSVVLIVITLVFSAGKRFFSKQPVVATQEIQVKSIEETPAKKPLVKKPLVEQTKQKTSKKITQAKPRTPTKQTKKETVNTKKTTSTRFFKVIAGAYKKKSLAQNHRKTLKSKGFDSFITNFKDDKGSTWFRIQVGAFQSHKKALAFQQNLGKKSFKSYIVSK